MQRRHVLKGLAAIAALPSVMPARALAPFQRVRPGDPGWPTMQAWNNLKTQVGGNLTRPTDLYAACATNAASSGCADALKEIGNPFFIGDQAGGTQTSGWLNAWSPKPSAYAVVAHRSEDVVAAVNFARQHRLRLAVKGGGHSYQGTSNAPDSLLVWTRPMHAITLHDRFVPQGCDTQPVSAVTIEAGAMWVDAYDAVTTKGGRYVQGGGCMTVGVAGLVQSGGFGSFSKRYGTAASSLLEAQIVTADGKLRTVNACNDPDLFWAVKGGGGGSFGVITSLTLKSHELPEFLGYASITIKAASDEDFRHLLARFVDFYASSLFNAHWGEHVSVFTDNRLGISMASAGLSKEQARAIWQPFLTWVAQQGSRYSAGVPEIGSNPAQSYWDVEAMHKSGSQVIKVDDRVGASPVHAWWTGDEEQVGAFLYGYDSLWMPKSLLEKENQSKLADALFEASRHMETRLDFNKGLSGGESDALARSRDTATNPQVLDAFALCLVATGGASRYPGLPPTRDQRQAEDGARGVDRATAIMRALAPDAGSYVSESNFFDAEWRQHYWGANYPRLAAIKAKYDPDGLFTVHHGVGSEDWSADGFTRQT
ncbi:MAG TPA: FAD-binding oxidoreductase [Rhizomicrobium sp.]|nr:FAD-binding oxidoreductase [Rhizomicrobium sp.]